MLTGVIFDMDGVIFDSHPIHKLAWRTFLGKMGRQVSEDELDFVLDGRKREEILRHFLGPLSEEQVRKHGLQKDAIFHEAAHQVSTIPGLIEFISDLEEAGIPKAVATCASENRARSMLSRAKLLERFDVIVTGCEVEHGKPDPSIFLMAARRLKVKVSGVLVVEDAVAGVQAAKAAGMKCLAISSYNRSDDLRRAGADCIAKDFSNLSMKELAETLFRERIGMTSSSPLSQV